MRKNITFSYCKKVIGSVDGHRALDVSGKVSEPEEKTAKEKGRLLRGRRRTVNWRQMGRVRKRQRVTQGKGRNRKRLERRGERERGRRRFHQ